MSNAASRFRKLPPPRQEPIRREREASGDLFEHFGVSSEPERGLPAAVVAAQACPTCGWLCRLDERACPLCAGALEHESRRSTHEG